MFVTYLPSSAPSLPLAAVSKVEQDNLRRTVLRELDVPGVTPTPGGIAPQLIYSVAAFARDHGYHVLLVPDRQVRPTRCRSIRGVNRPILRSLLVRQRPTRRPGAGRAAVRMLDPLDGTVKERCNP